MVGYIYIRISHYYDGFNACKLGKTLNIPDRLSTYITGEIQQGKFICVFQFDKNIIDDIELQLQQYFKKLNLWIYQGAGTEFFNKQIIQMIEPWFQSQNISYKKLSDEEIDNLIHKKREKKDTIKAKDDQKIIINESIQYFQQKKRGILQLICSYGKTLTSLWITQQLNCQKIIIGVPSLQLLKQWQEKILLIFPKYKILNVSGKIWSKDITNFITKNKKFFIVTTYHSSYRILELTDKLKFIFDMKILDEAHHVTTQNMDKMDIKNKNKTFIKILAIKSELQLGLTATLKNNQELQDDKIIGNNSQEYFGDIIATRNLFWGIKNEYVCDYKINTLVFDDQEVLQHLILTKKYIEVVKPVSKNETIYDPKDETIQRLFLSAYSALKSIQADVTHHLIIYTNEKNNSEQVLIFIKLLLESGYFQIDNLYANYYNSKQEDNDQEQILKDYNNAKFGILACVYQLGEGYDNPKIDGIVFAENMSSNIRIVQCALRAGRLNKDEPDKITNIIIPFIGDIEDQDNQDYKKIQEIVKQMGQEDQTIQQKIVVIKENIKKYPKKEVIMKNFVTSLGEFNKELTEKIRMISISRVLQDTSYNKAVEIVKEYNIQSKKQYDEICKKDCRLYKNPDEIYQSQFTNWIEYLSIDRKYYDLEQCKQKINEYIKQYPEIKKYYREYYLASQFLCEKDSNFPPCEFWIDYYNVKKIQEIINIPLPIKMKLPTFV